MSLELTENGVGWYEVLDRVYVAQFNWEHHIIHHLVMSEDTAIRDKADEVASLMAEIYQLVGSKAL